MGVSRKRWMIRLREAEAKYTRAKNGHDGSELAEVRYQKAKRDLAAVRQVTRQFPTTVKPGDAVATPETIQATMTDPRSQQ